jgi:DNA-binding protein HU-beta
MNKVMSKSELIQKIADQHADGMTRKDVKAVIEAVAEIGHKELKKTGAFLVPGLAKFVVIKKPATKARQGINPFTKEPTTFKARPARKIIRARPVKAAKDAVTPGGATVPVCLASRGSTIAPLLSKALIHWTIRGPSPPTSKIKGLF